MPFELNNLKRPGEWVEYKPQHIGTGPGVQMQLNLDWLTLAKMEETEAEFTRAIEESAPKEIGGGENSADDLNLKAKTYSIYHFAKTQMRYKARVLGGKQGFDDPNDRIIQSWDVISNGSAVPVCYETFLQMPQAMLDDLYEFCNSDAVKVKKTNGSPSSST